MVAPAKPSPFRVGALVFAATVALAFVVPDVDLGPFHAVNPNRIVRIAAAILGIQLLGELAIRRLGPRYGLLLSGFVAGFLSSTATIAAMGARAKDEPEVRDIAVAGGMASNVATILEYLAILAVVDLTLPFTLAWPLGFALVATSVVTLGFARGAERAVVEGTRIPGFGVAPAFVVAGGSALIAIGAAALDARFGSRGAVAGSAIAGLVDAHATAAGLGTLHSEGELSSSAAALAVTAALTANSITKLAMAWLPGSREYGMKLTSGILTMVVAAWLGLGIHVSY